MVNFQTSVADRMIIRRIVTRAIKEGGYPDTKDDRQNLTMDITAAHLNGCKLDLKKLLASEEFNFLHDMGGIRRHLNRTNGKLENSFVPRCAAKDVP